MDNEELIRHFKNILTGNHSEQDNQEFLQSLIQIAKEGDCYEKKPNPVYEALETLDDFLEELDEFYGLTTLKYGSEASRALETLRSWYIQQSDIEDENIDVVRELPPYGIGVAIENTIGNAEGIGRGGTCVGGIAGM